MSAPAYLPLFGSDYLADTRHLTTEEHGAYLLLMMAAWRQDDCGLPLDDKKLARISGLAARKWASMKDTILDFWTIENGRIFQSRLRKERGYADQKSESNRRSARSRWDNQVTDNKDTETCERISERNAPQPQPHKDEEANASPSKRGRSPAVAKLDLFPCPIGVDPLDWHGLIENRQKKRAPLSAAAHRQIVKKLEAWANTGWPPGPIVASAAERGWTTVFETDDMKAPANDQHQPRTSRFADQRESTRETAERIAAELLRASPIFTQPGFRN